MKNSKLRKFIAVIVFIIIEYVAAGLIFTSYKNKWKLAVDLRSFFSLGSGGIFLIFLAFSVLAVLLGYDKKFWSKNSMNILSEAEKKQITGNLEQSRFQTKKEIDINFHKIEYEKLKESMVCGVPVKAEVEGKEYNINIAPSAHTMVIGSTGSGKTTSFINPSIQILSESKVKPSMLIADPKGELYALHARSLIEKGYDVQVLDLRNPYNSIKWNPLEIVYEKYQKMLKLEDSIVQETGNTDKTPTNNIACNNSKTNIWEYVSQENDSQNSNIENIDNDNIDDEDIDSGMGKYNDTIYDNQFVSEAIGLKNNIDNNTCRKQDVHLSLEEKIGQGPWIFEGEKYSNVIELKNAIKVEKQKLFDSIYEDCNDFISILCPIKNKKDPIWESGAKNFILAIVIAMLEDSENEELGMTKEKFNFYNLAKIALNTENDCKELKVYFDGRGELSKSKSLSKQVLDSLDRTRGSYLSTIFDRLSIFSDLSICALTSKNEMSFSDMATKSVALFLQIPDEKETRHTLAAMVVLQAYKTLVGIANESENLSLPKPVYFILDEFGNLPRINKLEQMITVGRSRKIWLLLVLQSYAQLANVYDEKIAEIIKSNCNIQIFIGSTDEKTLESFSKHCGNYSVVTKNVSISSTNADNLSSSASVKERPLIYPSELSKLNNPKDMGNAIVSVFGYHPIRTKYTPSFLCPKLRLAYTKQLLAQSSFFDEENIFFDLKKRNAYLTDKKIFNIAQDSITKERETENESINISILIQETDIAVSSLFTKQQREKIAGLISKRKTKDALEMLELAVRKARNGKEHLIQALDQVRRRLEFDLDKVITLEI